MLTGGHDRAINPGRAGRVAANAPLPSIEFQLESATRRSAPPTKSRLRSAGRPDRCLTGISARKGRQLPSGVLVLTADVPYASVTLHTRGVQFGNLRVAFCHGILEKGARGAR